MGHPRSRMICRAAIGLALASVAGAGCGTQMPAAPEPSSGAREDVGVRVEVRTDAGEYSLGAGGRVRVRIANLGERPVYAELPGDWATVAVWREGAWHTLALWYGWVAVAPRLVTLTPGSSTPGVELPLTSAVLRGPGLYRFEYRLYEDAGLTRLLPPEARVSNVFRLAD